jgi:hypothetical protein
MADPLTAATLSLVVATSSVACETARRRNLDAAIEWRRRHRVCTAELEARAEPLIVTTPPEVIDRAVPTLPAGCAVGALVGAGGLGALGGALGSEASDGLPGQLLGGALGALVGVVVGCLVGRALVSGSSQVIGL